MLKLRSIKLTCHNHLIFINLFENELGINSRADQFSFKLLSVLLENVYYNKPDLICIICKSPSVIFNLLNIKIKTNTMVML